MVEVLLERIQRPHALSDYVRPPRAQPPQDDSSARMLIERINKRAWVEDTYGELHELLANLRGEINFIKHLPKCRFCQAELQIDVERYLGSRSPWWINLQDSEYLEEIYPEIPKEADYTIDNYWNQVAHYRKYGNTNTGANTMEFIFARAKWVFKYFGKQVHIARQMLRLVKNWNFTETTEREYVELYDKLNIP